MMNNHIDVKYLWNRRISHHTSNSSSKSVYRKRKAVYKWIFLLPLFLWNDISYCFRRGPNHEGSLLQDASIRLRYTDTVPLFSFLFVQAVQELTMNNQTLLTNHQDDEDIDKNHTSSSQQQQQQSHNSKARIRSNSSFHRGIMKNSEQKQQNTVDSSTSNTKLYKSPLTISQILKRAGKSGLDGGISGAIAGFIQVITLMWLRTVVNYQCRYGTTFRQAFITLYQQGGIARFYRGLSFALIQAPLARFVSTAANDGVETFVASLEATKHWGPGRTTIVASIVVGIWRMILMPIDTCKTILQVDSVEGFRNLMRKVKAGKIDVLYQGASANALSAILGHYPWFYTYTFLTNNELLKYLLPSKLLRHASIGFIASIISDTIVNVFRVVKTTKQSLVAKHAVVSYGEVVAMILAADGWKGLFGRGLGTRYLTNAVQSIVFTIIWRGLAEKWNRNNNEGNTSKREKTLNEAEAMEK